MFQSFVLKKVFKFLVKITRSLKTLVSNPLTEIPCDEAKPMLLIEKINKKELNIKRRVLSFVSHVLVMRDSRMFYSCGGFNTPTLAS